MLKRSIWTALLLVSGAAASCTWTVPAAAQSGSVSERLDAAEKKLDEDIKACRPINVQDYQDLANETNRNVDRAIQAIRAGALVDARRIDDEHLRAEALLKRAQTAAAMPVRRKTSSRHRLRAARHRLRSRRHRRHLRAWCQA